MDKTSDNPAGMKAVATHAGVAVSSVSRVLSGHPDVSQAMRDRVLRAVDELGYERNVLAQSLRRGTTMTVGFLVGDITNPLFSDIALGAELVLRDSGHAMLIANSNGEQQNDAAQLHLLQRRHVDGFIISLSDETEVETIERLATLPRPFVLLDREVAGVESSAVVSDHASGIRDTVRHLIELGHRRIGFIGGGENVRPTRVRAETLLAVCNEHSGVEPLVTCGSYTAGHGERASDALLDRSHPPTALLAGGNQILVGVLRTLRRRRLRIPDDLSLVTCDSVPLSEFLEPPLATIDRDPREMGRVAAELLLAAMGGEAPRVAELPVSFDPQSSCGPPPV